VSITRFSRSLKNSRIPEAKMRSIGASPVCRVASA
jgi:hypothetical protein